MKAPYLEVLVILVGRHTNIEGAIFKDGGANISRASTNRRGASHINKGATLFSGAST